jgi:hypothetical protein
MNPNPYPNQYRGAPQPGALQFRAGQMMLFVTTRPFTLGQTGVQVRSGTEILFDGTHAEVEGSEYVLPFLRGAVKAGWMVLAEEYDPNDPNYQRRTSANIQVRPRDGGNPLQPQQRMAIATTVSDEREVTQVRAHSQQTQTQNRNFVRGQTPVNVVQPGTKVMTQRGVMEVEVQDGIELDRQLSTPAGEKSKERLDLTSEKAARALRVARDAKVVPGVGQTEEDMMQRMSPEQQEEYIAKKEALRAQYVSEAPPMQSQPRPPHRQVVARVQSNRHGHGEGMQFTNSVGGGTAIGDESDGIVVGHVQEDRVETFEQEGMRFTTTNGPRRPQNQRQAAPQAPQAVVASAEAPPPVPANLDTRRAIAKMVCPEFPENYDFTLSPKKKLARLQADYEDRYDVLKAVYAAETDDMKALLLQEFPKAFEASAS